MRATLISFRLDMARVAVGSAGNLVPFVLPLFFAVVFGMAGRDGGSGFGIGGVTGSTYGVCSILPIAAFACECQEGHRRMNGVIPANRTHQVFGRYLTLLAFALVFLAEMAAALGVVALVQGGGPAAWGSLLRSSALPGVWCYVLLQLVLFPLFYKWSDVRRALLALCGLFLGFAALVALAVTFVPEPALDAFGGALDALLADPGVGVPLGVASLALAAALSLLASVRLQRRKEF